MATHVLRIPVDTGEKNARRAFRDRLIENDNGGVVFLADLAFPWCYPGGEPSIRPPAEAPQAGAVVRDVSERSGDGVFFSNTIPSVAFAGNGFDFSGVSAGVNQSVQTVSTSNDVFKGISVNQHYLIIMYVKLPVEADWNASQTIYPMFTATGYRGTYQRESELVCINQRYGGYLSFRRQKSINSQDDIEFSVSDFFGQFCQIAYWRNEKECGALIRTVDRVRRGSLPTGPDNSVDISKLKASFGGNASGFCGSSDEHIAASKYRLYRMAIEDLYVSKRDPETILAADWERTVNRGVFS